MPVFTPSRLAVQAGAAVEGRSADPVAAGPVKTGNSRHRRFVAPTMPAHRHGAAPARHAAWWQWPHLLSLDAPLVAVVWQWCWAGAAHVRLPWYDPCVLGLGVWLIYLSDRLADSTRAVAGESVTARHAFHGRWRVALSFLAASVAGALALLTPCVLTRAEFLHGLLLLALAATYFWLIHGSKRQDWTMRLPKEAAVGAMFAAGTAFFPWCDGSLIRFDFWAGAAIFGALCFCNCALITAWERHAQDVRNRSSLLNAFPWLTARLRGVCVVLACLAGIGLLLTKSLPFLPLALGGLLLAILDHHQKQLSPNALRVLADVALLTPLLFGSGQFF